MTSTDHSKYLDWLIVGGGTHGVHIAARLLSGKVNCKPRIGIIDPWPSLLYRWNQCTAATGMQYLRSPAVHNLGIDPFDLQKFAGKRSRYKQVYFRQPYSRPSLKFFKKHSEFIINSYGLSDLHIKSRVEKIVALTDSVNVTTESGINLNANKLVLAIGSGEHLNWPDWVPESPNISHLFSQSFTWPENGDHQSLAILGGGISAIQAAIHALHIGYRVNLISRHELRQHQFDSDPGWLGPKNMSGFIRETSYKKRRVMIQNARHKGSAPKELVAAIRKYISEEQINFHNASVLDAKCNGTNVDLDLDNGTQITSSKVLLATGFKKQRPGGKLIDDLLSSYQLPVAECGYPIVDSQLRWHPNIYVSGPLAELELGPSARNIAGARSAAARILGSLN